MQPIILIGGGGHCRACIDVIETEGKYRIEGIVDIAQKIGETLLGYPIIADDTMLETLAKTYPNFLITLGQIRSPHQRIERYDMLGALGATFPTIVSPLAHVSRHARLGQGSIVMHHALINAGACVGENCIINSKALVEHDAQIGHSCHISTGAIVNGGCIIGEETFLGSGSVCKEGIRIPPKSFIKATRLVVSPPCD